MRSTQKAKLIKFFFIAIAVFLALMLIQSRVVDDKKDLGIERVQATDSKSLERTDEQSQKIAIRAPAQVIVNQSSSHLKEDNKANEYTDEARNKKTSEPRDKSASSNQEIRKTPPSGIDQFASPDVVKPDQDQTYRQFEKADSPQPPSSEIALINDKVVGIPNESLKYSSSQINDTVVPNPRPIKQKENIAIGTKNIPSASFHTKKEDDLDSKKWIGVNTGQVDFDPSSPYRLPQAIFIFILLLISLKNLYHLHNIGSGRVFINTLSFKIINELINIVKLLRRQMNK